MYLTNEWFSSKKESKILQSWDIQSITKFMNLQQFCQFNTYYRNWGLISCIETSLSCSILKRNSRFSIKIEICYQFYEFWRVLENWDPSPDIARIATNCTVNHLFKIQNWNMKYFSYFLYHTTWMYLQIFGRLDSKFEPLKHHHQLRCQLW